MRASIDEGDDDVLAKERETMRDSIDINLDSTSLPRSTLLLIHRSEIGRQGGYPPATPASQCCAANCGVRCAEKDAVPRRVQAPHGSRLIMKLAVLLSNAPYVYFKCQQVETVVRRSLAAVLQVAKLLLRDLVNVIIRKLRVSFFRPIPTNAPPRMPHKSCACLS